MRDKDAPVVVIGAGRTLTHANEGRPLLARSKHPIVIGGGLIGMEIAAASAVLGRPVTVVETAGRFMAPAVSPEVAEHVARDRKEEP